jgi:hypothetical protein
VTGHRLAAALVAALVLGAGTGARADETRDKQALVLVRVLAYDRQVSHRSGKEVVIGVLYDDADPGSRGAAGAMARSLRAVSRDVTVAGRSIAVVELSAGDELVQRLRDLHVSALYLASGLDDEMGEIAAAARERPCLTFSDRAAYLRSGLAIALGTDPQNRRITIAIDLVAARQQGASLAAELLRVVEVVKR